MLCSVPSASRLTSLTIQATSSLPQRKNRPEHAASRSRTPNFETVPIWFQGAIDPLPGSAGRSRNANSNCIVALLFGGRLDQPAQKSVSDGARLEQIGDRAKSLDDVSFTCRWTTSLCPPGRHSSRSKQLE